jgi:hypothetical protein
MCSPALLESTGRLTLDVAANRGPKFRCKQCQEPCLKQDRGEIFPRLCSTCEAVRLESIVRRVLKRHGRKPGLARLRALASPAPAITDRVLAESRQAIRDKNAQGNRWPLCRKCRMPVHPNDHGVLYPRRCATCCFDSTWRVIERIARRWGAATARSELQALARGPMGGPLI